MKRMQQMIKFCTEHNILPDVEVVSCDQLPQVFKELCGDQPEAKRYVADMSTIDKLRC
jgi:D-arabinose 1-dehydrogenase-like Zn-dependent alcohol dehydrogenase